MLNNKNSDEIDLKEFFLILWDGKYNIILTTLLASIFIVFYSLSLPNIYKSDDVLAPVEIDNSIMGGSLGSLGDMSSLAGLAGIDISGGGSTDRTSIGMEVLQSRKFFEDFINNNNILVPLMASTGWNMSSNELIIDDEVYDIQNKKWVREPNPPLKAEPSSQEAFKVFNGLFSIEKNVKSGFINISIDHYSPYIAKQWLDLIIDQINEVIRKKDIEQANRAIGHLNDEIRATRLADLQNNLYSLVEKQIEKKVLAQATPEYVFQIIDPPIVPELKSSPRRAVICILGAIAGGILGCLITLIRFYYFPISRSA